MTLEPGPLPTPVLLRARFADVTQVPLWFLADTLTGVRHLVHLHIMAVLDLETVVGGDMRGRAGHEFMSSYHLANGASYETRVAELTLQPLEVLLKVTAGPTPGDAVVTEMIATFEKFQMARRAVGADPSTVARELIKEMIIEGKGPFPAGAEVDISTAISSATYALTVLGGLEIA